jgi:hypothetical protein
VIDTLAITADSDPGLLVIYLESDFVMLKYPRKVETYKFRRFQNKDILYTTCGLLVRDH